MNMKKFLAIGIAALSCITLGAFKAYASAPPPHSDKVTVKKVKFKNRIDITVVGNLYIPKCIEKNKKHPAIIVGHPFGGVKEQTAGLYAQKLLS